MLIAPLKDMCVKVVAGNFEQSPFFGPLPDKVCVNEDVDLYMRTAVQYRIQQLLMGNCCVLWYPPPQTPNSFPAVCEEDH